MIACAMYSHIHFRPSQKAAQQTDPPFTDPQGLSVQNMVAYMFQMGHS